MAVSLRLPDPVPGMTNVLGQSCELARTHRRAGQETSRTWTLREMVRARVDSHSGGHSGIPRHDDSAVDMTFSGAQIVLGPLAAHCTQGMG